MKWLSTAMDVQQTITNKSPTKQIRKSESHDNKYYFTIYYIWKTHVYKQGWK